MQLPSMRYDPGFVQPMREELPRLGFLELKTPDQVDASVREGNGTLLLVVNSVCGCAAGRAPPGAGPAWQHGPPPASAPSPPSPPQIALFKEGRLVFMLERKDIERRPPEEIARDLVGAFDVHCAW